MLFSELSKEERKDIAQQVAELINAFTSDGKLGGADIPPGLELCESCREVILDLPADWEDLFKPGTDIEQWIRGQMTWYHQLRTASEAFGFARSIEIEEGHHRVIEVVPSTVAHEFTKAIRSINAEDPGSPGRELPAVLLHIPRYSFYGLATVEAVGTEQGGWGTITLVFPFFHEQITMDLWMQMPLLLRDRLFGDLPDLFGKGSWLNRFPGLSDLLKPKGSF